MKKITVMGIALGLIIGCGSAFAADSMESKADQSFKHMKNAAEKKEKEAKSWEKREKDKYEKKSQEEKKKAKDATKQ